MNAQAVRYDKDCYRIMVGETIVGFALRLTNNRWCMTDTNDKHLSKQSYARPDDVAAAWVVEPEM